MTTSLNERWSSRNSSESTLGQASVTVWIGEVAAFAWHEMER
jgi:hypothetical protein